MATSEPNPELQRVNMYRPLLAERLIPSQILHSMAVFLPDPAKCRELRAAARGEDNSGAVNRLLDVLIEQDLPGWFQGLISALERAGFHYLAALLAGKTNMKDDKMERSLINIFLPVLQDVDCRAIMPALLANGCITSADREKIEACLAKEGSMVAAVTMILDHVPSKSDNWFSKFISALNANGYDHLTETIEEKLRLAQSESAVCNIQHGMEVLNIQNEAPVQPSPHRERNSLGETESPRTSCTPHDVKPKFLPLQGNLLSSCPENDSSKQDCRKIMNDAPDENAGENYLDEGDESSTEIDWQDEQTTTISPLGSENLQSIKPPSAGTPSDSDNEDWPTGASGEPTSPEEHAQVSGHDTREESEDESDRESTAGASGEPTRPEEHAQVSGHDTREESEDESDRESTAGASGEPTRPEEHAQVSGQDTQEEGEDESDRESELSDSESVRSYRMSYKEESSGSLCDHPPVKKCSVCKREREMFCCTSCNRMKVCERCKMCKKCRRSGNTNASKSAKASQPIEAAPSSVMCRPISKYVRPPITMHSTNPRQVQVSSTVGPPEQPSRPVPQACRQPPQSLAAHATGAASGSAQGHKACSVCRSLREMIACVTCKRRSVCARCSQCKTCRRSGTKQEEPILGKSTSVSPAKQTKSASPAKQTKSASKSASPSAVKTAAVPPKPSPSVSGTKPCNVCKCEKVPVACTRCGRKVVCQRCGICRKCRRS